MPPEDVTQAQEELEVKRKLTRILQGKSSSNPTSSVGDFVEVFVPDGKQKGGKWSSLNIVLKYSHKSRTITVPGTTGKTLKAAFEDDRHAFSNDSLVSLIWEANDPLGSEMTDMMDLWECNESYPSSQPITVDSCLDVSAQVSKENVFFHPTTALMIPAYCRQLVARLTYCGHLSTSTT